MFRVRGGRPSTPGLDNQKEVLNTVAKRKRSRKPAGSVKRGKAIARKMKRDSKGRFTGKKR